jgi:hypothetical protein
MSDFGTKSFGESAAHWIENINRNYGGGKSGLSQERIDAALSNMPTFERPWYDRTPWSYVIGATIGAPFTLGLNALTKWLGWT